jgi:hypothetical protein
MKRGCAFMVLLAFFFGYGVPIASANVCVTPPIKRRQACGTVLAFDGQPIPSATVSVRYADLKLETVTDEAGRFTFRDLIKGPAQFDVNASGFSSMRFTLNQVVAVPSRCTKQLWVMLDLAMDPCSVVASRFKDLPLRKRGIPTQ